MKKYALLLFFIAAIQVGWTQTGSFEKALIVGDTVPDFSLRFLGSPASSARFSDFKGKRVVLDFWSTWCSACLEALPKLEALQKRYPAELVVLPVTTQTYGHIDSFKKRNKVVAKSTLPLAVDAANLGSLFPHTLEPHIVWINEKGVVEAITEGGYVTAANIQKFIAGDRLQLPQKRDVMDYDASRPLLLQNNGAPENAFALRSIASPYLEGLPTRVGRYLEKGGTRVAAINAPVLNLCWLAYPQLLSWHSKKVIYELQPQSPYRLDDLEEASDPDAAYHRKSVSYELIVPTQNTQQIQQWVAKDLEQFFGLTGKVERRKIACLVLQTTPGKKAPRPPKTPAVKRGEEWLVLRQEAATPFVDLLNDDPLLPLVMDQTAGALLTVSLPTQNRSLTSWQSLLRSHGLQLVPIEVEMEVFVLTEQKNTPMGYSLFKQQKN